jgi:hypothetical protein
LDGDGDADVLSASSGDDKIAWYENQGGGSFGPQQVITTNADGAWSAYATDLDGDGDAEVLSASQDDDKIAWYENQGTTDRPGEKSVDKPRWRLYPNPTEGVLKLGGSAVQPGQPLQLTIRDLRGRTVAERTLHKNRTQLDLTPGLYSVTLQQGRQRTHRKLIVR